MIVEIEYYKGDILLYGSHICVKDFVRQIKTIESIYDRQEDNFIELLCRNYGWLVCTNNLKPEYVYDRDIEKVYKKK